MSAMAHMMENIVGYAESQAARIAVSRCDDKRAIAHKLVLLAMEDPILRMGLIQAGAAKCAKAVADSQE